MYKKNKQETNFCVVFHVLLTHFSYSLELVVYSCSKPTRS